jgi:1,4-alpha-glucan branching enzyme
MNAQNFGAKALSPQTTFFRVWAPNAKQVDVVGDFNQWQVGSSPLNAENDGFWEGTLQGIGPGDRYKYALTKHNGDVKYRIDPAARDTQDSRINNIDNHGLVVDMKHGWPEFNTPAFDDLILYQCHVGSFCGRDDGLHRPNWVATFADLHSKLDYIRELGFNAIALLPIQEFRLDRSWGYNPSFYYALESAYGRPADLMNLVDQCHQKGIAVIFDVVYNHISNRDSSFWHFDENSQTGKGRYLSDFETPWGLAPAFWERSIQDFYLQNMGMYLEEYKGDGLRFDATRYIELNRGLGNDGWAFMQYLTYMAKERYPGKFLIAEHVPEHDSIVNSAGFHAAWCKSAYERFGQAMSGNNPVENIKALLGKDLGDGQRYPHTYSPVKYLLGSHDECGDNDSGRRGHRYFVEHFGGRDNWHARAKTRLGWALNIAVQNTPMLFMGNECCMWGYWHDGADQHGDHRFDWSIAGDHHGIPMRKLVAAANHVRWAHPALRRGLLQVTHEDPDNNVLAFKRWNHEGDVILIVVNCGETNFTQYSYGLRTGQAGQWQQILCTQDNAYGGWDGAGNAYYQPWTQADGKIYINLPKWSLVMFNLL